jgi:asparagine synthase (glutamine-hydrolysing)
MCGIFGAVSLTDRPLSHERLLPQMAVALQHRGPDSSRLFRTHRCAVGANRLRIVDRTTSADQPFITPDGRIWLACNGEIYNSSDLRDRYRGYPFRSRSDIEVVLPAYAALGLDVFRELDGMFAIALWNEATESLVLARDRAGEKPLFYARIDDELWFAQEMQALLLHPRLTRDIDEVAISQYLTLGFPLEPRTAFKNIRRVEAGTALVANTSGLRVHRYWNPVALVRQSRPVRPDEVPQRVEKLRRLIEGAVQRQLTADADVGVFMSGGLDSCLMATIAARAVGRDRIASFTARFDAESYDEGAHAAACSARVGTRHLSVPCGNEHLLRALCNVSSRVAEPIADPAILPTYLLAETARQHVRVVLTGEGADELFGGYPTYLGHGLAERIAVVPRSVRRCIRRLVNALPVSQRKVGLEFLLKRFVRGIDLPWPERHLQWFGTGGGAGICTVAPATWIGQFLDSCRDLGSQRGPMVLDYQSYLRDGLLVKIDRATMLHSIEARAPYLDRAATEFAFDLPPELKVRGVTTKWILKQAAATWISRAQLTRRKRGLSVPIAGWINNELANPVDELLSPGRLNRHGLMDSAVAQQLLGEHRANKFDHSRALWAAIMLQLWLERWQPDLAADSAFGVVDFMPGRRVCAEIWPHASNSATLDATNAQ